ncbi:MAG: Fur family transcriptional regulator [Bdellovibrionales bacterium]
MTDQIIKKAEEFCEAYKYRLTEPRLQVLKIIVSAPQPQGAYDILHELGKVIKSPKPPTVYRAIEFWQEHNFIHRIESMNAYVACEAGHRHKGSQFMICDDCGDVQETHLCDLPSPLKNSTEENTFKPKRWNFEIHGTCEKCDDA